MFKKFNQNKCNISNLFDFNYSEIIKVFVHLIIFQRCVIMETKRYHSRK